MRVRWHGPGGRRDALTAAVGLILLLALRADTIGCGSAVTAETVVSDPYATPALEGGTTAVYFTMTNGASARVTTVSTDAGGTAGFYRSEEEDGMGMSSMDPVEQLDLPKGVLSLEPGGTHVMAGPVTIELGAGDDIEVTLAFDDGREQSFTAMVRSFGDIAAMSSNDEGQPR